MVTIASCLDFLIIKVQLHLTQQCSLAPALALVSKSSVLS